MSITDPLSSAGRAEGRNKRHEQGNVSSTLLIFIIAAGGGAMLFSLNRLTFQQLDWYFVFLLVAMATVAAAHEHSHE